MDFTLDAYAARTCAVKTQHLFTPGLTPGPVDESLQDSFHGGIDHVAHVAELLMAAHRDIVDLREVPRGDAEAACADAMDAGVAVIMGGELRPDPAGHRRGRVNVLVRAEDVDGSGRPAYRPVLVKPRRIMERRVSGRENVWEVPCSPLHDLAYDPGRVADDRALRRHENDFIQVSHLYRLLEAHGRTAPGARMAGIIGTDEVPGVGSPVVTWVDLDEPFLKTFSRSEPTGRKSRSPLERHDHEHAFRVQVAENALVGGEPLIEPVRIRECDWCPWWRTCEPILGPNDLSARIDTAPLDVREIRTLRAMGIRTIDDLAGADLESLLPEYLPEVTHRSQADSRLRNAARRSRMLRDGVELERTTEGPILIDRADLEIDFDLETYDDRAYLWGFLVHDRRSDERPYYKAFTSWAPMDDAAELTLASEALEWLRDISATARTRVYHYSSYETRHVGQLVGSGGTPHLDWVLPWVHEHFVDLYASIKNNFFGCHGLGLKVVAQVGAGFQWRDAEPDGLKSLQWYEEAVGAETDAERAAARRRLLEYNEDDVRATHHLRAWLDASA